MNPDPDEFAVDQSNMKNLPLPKRINGSPLFLCLWGMIDSIQAESSGQTLNINGKGFGKITSDTTTSGLIVGAGVLNGRIDATFIDRKVSGGGLSGVDATTLSYVATLVINAKRGTVTTQDVGIFDTANGIQQR